MDAKSPVECRLRMFKWTNQAVKDYVNLSFSGSEREAVYAALIWVGDNWPTMKASLGIEEV
jgi:hypothetical protein